MTLSEFEHILGAYGSDPDRWPEDVRDAAKDFMTVNEAAAAQHIGEAARIDEALGHFVAPPPGDLLKGRILRSLPPQPAVAHKGAGPAPRWRSVAAMVIAAFGLGFGGSQYLTLAGTSGKAPAVVVSASTSETAWVETAEDLGFSDVYDWVEGEDI